MLHYGDNCQLEEPRSVFRKRIFGKARRASDGGTAIKLRFKPLSNYSAILIRLEGIKDLRGAFPNSRLTS